MAACVFCYFSGREQRHRLFVQVFRSALVPLLLHQLRHEYFCMAVLCLSVICRKKERQLEPFFSRLVQAAFRLDLADQACSSCTVRAVGGDYAQGDRLRRGPVPIRQVVGRHHRVDDLQDLERRAAKVARELFFIVDWPKWTGRDLLESSFIIDAQAKLHLGQSAVLVPADELTFDPTLLEPKKDTQRLGDATEGDPAGWFRKLGKLRLGHERGAVLSLQLRVVDRVELIDDPGRRHGSGVAHIAQVSRQPDRLNHECSRAYFNYN